MRSAVGIPCLQAREDVKIPRQASNYLPSLDSCSVPAVPRHARGSLFLTKARWQSGHAAACKAAYSGSIPLLASRTPCHGLSQNHETLVLQAL
jgi:hypothetical protein